MNPAGPRRPLARAVFALAVIAVLALTASGCLQRHDVTYEMHWSTGDEPGHVYLEFADYPNHYVDLRSLELEDYLRTLGTDSVAVLWDVRTRLGCVASIREVRIGERDDWSHRWAGSGWVGTEHPSPWARFECRIPWW